MITSSSERGHVNGRRPAGFEPIPSFSKTRFIASPPASAGKKHSNIALTLLEIKALIMFKGPPLNKSKITSLP